MNGKITKPTEYEAIKNLDGERKPVKKWHRVQVWRDENTQPKSFLEFINDYLKEDHNEQ